MAFTATQGIQGDQYPTVHLNIANRVLKREMESDQESRQVSNIALAHTQSIIQPLNEEVFRNAGVALWTVLEKVQRDLEIKPWNQERFCKVLSFPVSDFRNRLRGRHIQIFRVNNLSIDAFLQILRRVELPHLSLDALHTLRTAAMNVLMQHQSRFSPEQFKQYKADFVKIVGISSVHKKGS